MNRDYEPTTKNTYECNYNKFFEIDRIPFLSGRPVRNEIINQDDINNLKIDLNNFKDVKEFLNNLK